MSRSRMPKFAAKRDLTDKPIRDALRECGCFVFILSEPRVNDLAIYNRVRRRWYMVDTKTKKVKKTEHQNWDEEIGPGAIPFCLTIEQALDACEVSLIKRADVGELQVATHFGAGLYITDVINPGIGTIKEYKVFAVRNTYGYSDAKAMQERMVIAAMNYRDFKTPFDDPVPFEELNPGDADEARPIY